MSTENLKEELALGRTLLGGFFIAFFMAIIGVYMVEDRMTSTIIWGISFILLITVVIGYVKYYRPRIANLKKQD